AGMITVHASGGRDMIAAAREAVEGSDTHILAVTILTSLSAEMLQREVGLPETPEAAALRLGRQAIAAGAHGLVCSPQEARVLRAAIGPKPLLVTPVVRPEWAAKDDQARVATPREAGPHDGATHIVVGRPILGHANPAEAVRLINEELAS
ncbi:MAG: orotidine 5'-phosphate decarboxylase / HUMPS family protein, partial [Candidatus Hydrogenedentales bacterium]